MFPVFLRLLKPLIALALTATCQPAWAGPEEDYKAGFELYTKRNDVVNSVPLLRSAADAGHAQAQAVLAGILDYSEFDEEALAYYRKSAAQGNVDGQFGLATMLTTGEGGSKDPVEARRLLTLAAEQGHKQAVNVLAQAYISGQLEITEEQRQSPEALHWIKLSADANYLPAMKALIDAHRTGGYGMPVDTAAANELQTKYYDLMGLDAKGKPKKKGK